MRARIGLVAALGLFACGLLGAASASPGPAPKGGKPLGLIQRHAGGGTGGRAARRIGLDGTPVDPTLPLTDHGGLVMQTQRVYLIFWAPSGYSFDPSYVNGIEQFAQNLGSDPGNTTSPYGAIKQYGVNDVFAYGGAVMDTQPYPANGSSDCPTGPTGTVCLTDSDLFNEIARVQTANGWTGGFVNQFALVLPPGVDTCYFDNLFFIDWVCSYNRDGITPGNFGFCAYHSWYQYNNAPTVPYPYLNLPYEVQQASGCHTTDGTTVQPEPNGTADVLIGSMSHEEREAATDPNQKGWFDANGNEADDKCFITFGSLIGQTGGSIGFNQLLNGHGYETQTEWSNALMGCYQVGPPTVTSFSPSVAQAGATVTLHGTNFFSALGGVPTVKFNGIASTTVHVVSPTQLTAIVPPGNAQGVIDVTALGGTGTSTASLTQLTITGLSSTTGHAGDVVTITGTALTGTRSVTFGGVTATFTAGTPAGTVLRATVPTAAVDGDVTVTTAAGSASAPTPFAVLPSITSLSPTSGPTGTTVTISGSGLATTTSVTFGNDNHANVGSHSATQLLIGIPDNASAGPIEVFTSHGSVTSTGSFSPLPTISGFGAARYKPGDTATVTGANFTASGPVSVTVNGVAACGPCSASATSATFTVPNTVTGPVVVTNGDGSATSASPLHILPRIDSISGGGGAGTTVVIHGAGFTGATSVAFGGGTEPAAYVVGSGGTLITATVPASATTGAIAVSNPDGTTLSGASFFVAPQITSFAPTTAVVGQAMQIKGGGLSGADRVDFAGGVSAVPTSVSGTVVQVTVPAGALTGVFSVHTPSGSVTSTRPLTISFSVSRFAPQKADFGATVTITGSALTGVTAVLFNGVPGTGLAVVDDAHVTVHVPASGSLTGPITVMKGSVSVRTPTLFTLFGLHGATPNAGPAGTTVVLSGVGLSAVTRVTFTGGVTAPFTVDSDTQITVVVPAGAQNGTITVSVPGAQASVPYDVT